MEYVIWGIPPGADPADVRDGLAECVLHTTAQSADEAAQVAEVLRTRHGCTGVRVQTLDLTADGSSVRRAFAAAVRAR